MKNTYSRRLLGTLVGFLGLLAAAAFYFHGSPDDFFMPHAHCYLFNPRLMLLHGGSDLLIGLSYVSISATLVYLVVRARSSLPFHWMMLAFATFIVACGATHFMEVFTLRNANPPYWTSGWVKLITAGASVITAILLPPLVPKVRGLLQAARLSGERKEKLEAAYTELDSLYKRVKELDEVKTSFFANISHELRTPLSLISGPVERMLTQSNFTNSQVQDLTVIHRNTMLLRKHVNDILDVSKLDAGKMEMRYAQVDLPKMIRCTVESFATMVADRAVTVDVDAPKILLAELDGDKVQRIVLNLLSNAVKFVPDRGKITVSVKTDGADAVIRVEDSGPGIAPELRDSIFDRFAQGNTNAHQTFGGTGLGLSIIKDFAELHRGTATISDSPLGGAAFTVRLPLKAPTGTPLSESVWNTSDPLLAPLPFADSAHKTDAHEASANSESDSHDDLSFFPRKPVVLVAEDNGDMNQFIQEILGPEIQTISARDGLAALESARTYRPDLILADMMMPEMCGNDLLKALRAEPELATIPVVFLTAKADDELKMHMLAAGAQDYVMKPFAIDELRLRIRNHLTTKLSRDILRRELASHSDNLMQLTREITVRTRQLAEAQKSAELANQAKDRFLAVLSHELRTPLTPALAAISSLQESEDGSKDIPEALVMIRRNIEIEARLVDDLLDLTRVSHGKMRLDLAALDLHRTIQHAVEMCASRIEEKGLELVLELKAAEHHVHGDVSRMTQIFWNILLNAVKFTPPRGRIVIRSVNRAASLITVEIQDSGVGIETAFLPHVFEPFQQETETATRSLGGLGIGLAVARNLVELHDGRIHVHSPGRNRGTTFDVEFSTVNPGLMEEPIGEEPNRIPMKPAKVLLVEDHADTRDTLARLLERWGHTVETATTVREALRQIEAGSFDLLLSDIGLPDGTGVELYETIQKTHPMKAIAMSGFGTELDIRKSRNAGFADHLIKPVSAERLKAAMREVLETETVG